MKLGFKVYDGTLALGLSTVRAVSIAPEGGNAAIPAQAVTTILLVDGRTLTATVGAGKALLKEIAEQQAKAS